MRRLFTFSAVVVLMFSTMVVVAPAAFATAQSCTSAPRGYVCNTTYGSGARVDRVAAIRAQPQTCNYSADMSVLDPWGRVKHFQHKSFGGCSYVRSWIWFDVYRTFRCGDETSVRWYENGVPQGGYANVVLC